MGKRSILVIGLWVGVGLLPAPFVWANNDAPACFDKIITQQFFQSCFKRPAKFRFAE